MNSGKQEGRKKTAFKMIHSLQTLSAMTIPEDFWIKTTEHLILSLGAVSFAIPIALGGALLSQGREGIKQSISSFMSIFQTIPSLALFAFLIPFLGIGKTPALFALTLYAILPILRSTMTALEECPQPLSEAAQVFGLTPFQILLRVQFPQSLPQIISGIRTALVWTIGSASLATFIGAGGLGDYIARGIALLDTQLLLTGAIPTAFLAILFDFIFSKIEMKANAWKQGKQ